MPGTRRAQSTVVVLFVFICIGLPFMPGLSAENMVIEGSETWRIILSPAKGQFTELDVLKDYENNSNRQIIVEATPKRIIIERTIDYSPLESTVLLADAWRYAEDPALKPYLEKPQPAHVLSISDRLSEGKTTQIEYVDAVLYYLRDKLVWRSTNVIDPEPVLKQGYTVCSGFANTAAALLRARGLPARVVHVQTLKHPTWNAGGHAELEVYYDDLGWVSYDPQKHHHHTPYPRVRLGQSPGARIYSSNQGLWRAAHFFGKNPYQVRYEKLGGEVKTVAMLTAPEKHDFVSRNDGYGERIPVIMGSVYDGAGNANVEPYLYYSLAEKPGNYNGTPLLNGSYMIKNDENGGRLYLNKNGYIVFYDFPGYSEGETIVHDIRFDETDAIIIDTGTNYGVVKWWFRSNSYYTFKAGKDGTVRLHLNPGRYKVNDVSYEYVDGYWIEKD